ncbi:MAG: hypothetical protein LUG95_00615 [Clostridiales bacterium]|nr:hypothetical protein [Clostridiales bacterium]
MNRLYRFKVQHNAISPPCGAKTQTNVYEHYLSLRIFTAECTQAFIFFRKDGLVMDDSYCRSGFNKTMITYFVSDRYRLPVA